MSKAKVILGIGIPLGLVSILLLVVLLPLSFFVVQIDEYALVYHQYTCILETNVYQEGRHFTGDPGAKATVLKRTFTQFVFDDSANQTDYANLAETDSKGSISCYSRDGLFMTITCRAFYVISNETIYDIYSRFDDYEALIVSLMRSSVINACGQLPATTFAYDRPTADKLIRDTAITELTNINVTVPFFQVMDINLPSSFAHAISQKEQAKIDVNTALNERVQALIVAQASVEKARINAQLSVTVATSEAVQINVTAVTTGEVDKISRAAVETSLHSYLNLLANSTDELLKLFAIDNLALSKDVTVFLSAPARFGAALGYVPPIVTPYSTTSSPISTASGSTPTPTPAPTQTTTAQTTISATPSPSTPASTASSTTAAATTTASSASSSLPASSASSSSSSLPASSVSSISSFSSASSSASSASSSSTPASPSPSPTPAVTSASSASSSAVSSASSTSGVNSSLPSSSA